MGLWKDEKMKAQRGVGTARRAPVSKALGEGGIGLRKLVLASYKVTLPDSGEIRWFKTATGK